MSENLNETRCPYCFRRIIDPETLENTHTDDPILLPNGASKKYNQTSGLLESEPDIEQRKYKGFTIVKNKHIKELQDIYDDNKPETGWTPVQGEIEGYWIPNKIHIKELRNAIEKRLDITEKTTPADRIEIMELYLNYDEEGTERQNPHQLDWNDPNLTGTIWQGKISHMHIEDLRKDFAIFRFEQLWWGNGIFFTLNNNYVTNTYQSLYLPARESLPNKKNYWLFQCNTTGSTGSWTSSGNIIRTGSCINISSTHNSGSLSYATVLARADYDNPGWNFNKNSKIRIIYNSTCVTSASVNGGNWYERKREASIYLSIGTQQNLCEIVLRSVWENYNMTYPPTPTTSFLYGGNNSNLHIVTIAPSGDITINLWDLVNSVQSGDWKGARVYGFTFFIYANSFASSNSSSESSLMIDNFIYSPNGNVNIPAGE